MKMCVYSDIYTEGLGGTRSSVSSCRCLEDEAHAPPPAGLLHFMHRWGSPFPQLGKTQSNFSLYIQFCKYNSKCFIHSTTIQTIKDVFGNQNCSIITFLKRSIFFTLGAELCSTWCLLPEGTAKSYAVWVSVTLLSVSLTTTGFYSWVSCSFPSPSISAAETQRGEFYA